MKADYTRRCGLRATHAKRLLPGCCFLLLALCPGLVSAATLKLVPETSGQPGSGFRRLTPTEIQVQPDGSFVMSIMGPSQYFRLLIENLQAGPGTPVLLADAPAAARERALRLLAHYSHQGTRGDEASEDDQWENASLGPYVCPIFDPAAPAGSAPALLEFKVIQQRPLTRLQRGALVDPPVDRPSDAGFILVSLTEDNFPVVKFSNEGKTPVEKLIERAGTADLVPLMYDNTLLVGEDRAGRLLANVGSSPFYIPPAALAELRQRHAFTGDDDLGTDVRPPRTSLGALHYASYAEFKNDFLTNPVYQELRRRRAVHAHEQWEIEKGNYPSVITINVGEERVILQNQPIRSFHFFSEDGAALRAETLPNNGGLRLVGTTEGDGELRVELSERNELYAVAVQGRRRAARPASFVPGLQPPKKWNAGTWVEQPRYFQHKSSNWCPCSGCGPIAWTMLFAWFEREHGIKAAFGSLTTLDAPADGYGYTNTAKIFPVEDELHDQCDVICFPSSDQGATEPSDMAEGGLGYTYIRTIAGLIKRSWNMKWTIEDDCPEDGALETANAVKKGYPGVVGLGWLWHYALAYGYARQEFRLTEQGPPLTTYRYLKCNLGWGDCVEWYNLCDTFFSSDFRIRNGPNAAVAEN